MMRFFVRYVVPVVAGGLFVVAVMHVVNSNKKPQIKPTRINNPPSTPFPHTVAASGIVEAETENIAVGSPVPGVVEEVYVKVNQVVRPQTALFRLRTRQLEAQLQVRRALRTSAQAEYDRLRSLPRAEEKPVKLAAVAEAKARMEERRLKRRRLEAAYKKQAVSEDEVDTARKEFEAAQAAYQKAQAEWTLLNAGASDQELAVARAAVNRADAEIKEIETEIERRTIRTLVEGKVLQVNVRPGEFVGAPPSQALILLGSTKRLHVRVDIDEHDIPRFRPGAPAVAMLKGYPQLHYELTFQRVEPYVIPKKSLTGENTERVDTRVLQVIYEITDEKAAVYVGQQMDVFIQALPPPEER